MSEAEAPALPRVRPVGSDRHRLLVETAYDLLADKGLDGLTIRAVLSASGLARRAFYESFSGKDDLVLAVFAETLKLAAHYFEAQVSGIAGPLERLRFIVEAIVLGQDHLGGRPDAARDRRGAALSREHMRLAESHPEELHKALRPLIDLIARQLAAGMDAGMVRRAEPERMAVLVYNLVSTTVHTELLAAEGQAVDPARRRELAGDIWEFCRRAIIA